MLPVDLPWREIWETQREQQLFIHSRLPIDPLVRRALAHKFAVAAQNELHDYLNAAAFKDFFPSRELPRETKLMELVDAFKYILAAAWAEGFTAQEFLNGFAEKTFTVSERWKQRAVTGPKFCGFDIDGVICEYGTWAPNESEFVASGGVRLLRPIEGATNLLSRLKQAGWTIVLITARKKYLHGMLESDTRRWLAEHGFAFDAVLFAQDKGQAIADLGIEMEFFVDDSLKHALDCAKEVKRSFWFGSDSPGHAGATVAVKDLLALEQELESMGCFAWIGNEQSAPD